jgi:hypothetical protein
MSQSPLPHTYQAVQPRLLALTTVVLWHVVVLVPLSWAVPEDRRPASAYPDPCSHGQDLISLIVLIVLATLAISVGMGLKIMAGRTRNEAGWLAAPFVNKRTALKAGTTAAGLGLLLAVATTVVPAAVLYFMFAFVTGLQCL